MDTFSMEPWINGMEYYIDQFCVKAGMQGLEQPSISAETNDLLLKLQYSEERNGIIK